MIYDEHVLLSGSLISSNHGWLYRQEYAYRTGLQLKNLRLALKRDPLSTNTAHALLQLTAGGRTWEAAPGCLHTVPDVFFSLLL